MKNIKNKILPIVFLLFIFSFVVLFCVSPKKYMSEKEKRVLTQMPKLSAQALKSGEYTENLNSYFSDHFPYRDEFLQLDSFVGLSLNRNGENGVYKGKNGYLIAEPFEFSEEKAQKNANTLYKLIEKSELPTTVLIVPTKGYILSDALPKNHKQYKDKEAISIFKQTLTNATVLDLEKAFNEQKNTTQIYFKTDHHLTAEGSKICYDEFCKLKGYKMASFNKTESINDFYGTAYAKSGYFKNEADTVNIYSTNTKFTVKIDDGKGEKIYTSLYFESHKNELDKYPVFLDGNHSKVQIHNNSLKNGKKLLIIKDSYSHIFTTYLAEHYEDIVTIDLRYYKSSVSKLIENEGFSECIIMYGSENISTSTDLAWALM